VKADDYGSLGFGAGYGVARENICLLADLYLTASAER
jgi:acyl-homoserine-lactone acylase